MCSLLLTLLLLFLQDVNELLVRHALHSPDSYRGVGGFLISIRAETALPTPDQNL